MEEKNFFSTINNYWDCIQLVCCIFVFFWLLHSGSFHFHSIICIDSRLTYTHRQTVWINVIVSIFLSIVFFVWSSSSSWSWNERLMQFSKLNPFVCMSVCVCVCEDICFKNQSFLIFFSPQKRMNLNSIQLIDATFYHMIWFDLISVCVCYAYISSSSSSSTINLHLKFAFEYINGSDMKKKNHCKSNEIIKW